MKNTNRIRTRGELRALRDEEWLRLHESGRTPAELAEETGVSVQLMRRALSRARKERDSRIGDTIEDNLSPLDAGNDQASDSPGTRKPWWLELVPLFPIGAFTPSSECPHRGPIPEGSLLCCMVCSASGVDEHPALHRAPATDPRPEPKARTKRRAPSGKVRDLPSVNAEKPESRRERRSRIFGETPATKQSIAPLNSRTHNDG